MHESIDHHLGAGSVFPDRNVKRARRGSPGLPERDRPVGLVALVVMASQVIETDHIDWEPIGRGEAAPR